MIEQELEFEKPSCIGEVIEAAMLANPRYWERHYRGTEAELRLARRYSFSDRVRYYWTNPRVQAALKTLMEHLGEKALPLSLVSQFASRQYERIRLGEIPGTPEGIIFHSIRQVLMDYKEACRA